MGLDAYEEYGLNIDYSDVDALLNATTPPYSPFLESHSNLWSVDVLLRRPQDQEPIGRSFGSITSAQPLIVQEEDVPGSFYAFEFTDMLSPIQADYTSPIETVPQDGHLTDPTEFWAPYRDGPPRPFNIWIDEDPIPKPITPLEESNRERFENEHSAKYRRPSNIPPGPLFELLEVGAIVYQLISRGLLKDSEWYEWVADFYQVIFNRFIWPREMAGGPPYSQVELLDKLRQYINERYLEPADEYPLKLSFEMFHPRAGHGQYNDGRKPSSSLPHPLDIPSVFAFSTVKHLLEINKGPRDTVEARIQRFRRSEILGPVQYSQSEASNDRGFDLGYEANAQNMDSEMVISSFGTPLNTSSHPSSHTRGGSSGTAGQRDRPGHAVGQAMDSMEPRRLMEVTNQITIPEQMGAGADALRRALARVAAEASEDEDEDEDEDDDAAHRHRFLPQHAYWTPSGGKAVSTLVRSPVWMSRFSDDQNTGRNANRTIQSVSESDPSHESHRFRAATSFPASTRVTPSGDALDDIFDYGSNPTDLASTDDRSPRSSSLSPPPPPPIESDRPAHGEDLDSLPSFVKSMSSTPDPQMREHQELSDHLLAKRLSPGLRSTASFLLHDGYNSTFDDDDEDVIEDA
ncbi:hypothetical protein DL93DRAFT_1964171 [Clavulina sp. PMI_390]|nr:hypothetical protein DL93DRAFT_1964171 [Clavulina sp. PMI_390]